MTHNFTQQTLNRLLAIDWEADEALDKHEKSRTVLMLEYLRRAALWAQLLEVTNEWPFFDVVTRMASNVQVDQLTFNRLDEISAYIFRQPVRRMVESMLRWAALQDLRNIKLPELPDPYEPLLIMFERGGGFHIEHGFINFGHTMLPIKTWKMRISPPQGSFSLDSAELDRLDRI